MAVGRALQAESRQPGWEARPRRGVQVRLPPCPRAHTASPTELLSLPSPPPRHDPQSPHSPPVPAPPLVPAPCALPPQPRTRLRVTPRPPRGLRGLRHEAASPRSLPPPGGAAPLRSAPGPPARPPARSLPPPARRGPPLTEHRRRRRREAGAGRRGRERCQCAQPHWAGAPPLPPPLCATGAAAGVACGPAAGGGLSMAA